MQNALGYAKAFTIELFLLFVSLKEFRGFSPK